MFDTLHVSMYLLRLVLSSVILCASVHITLAQFNDKPPNAEPGKCYARSTSGSGEIMISEGQWLDTLLFVYVGEERRKRRDEWHWVELDTVKQPTRWDQVPDRDCNTGNPKDCMVWCLLQTPPLKLRVVNDTFGRTDYSHEYYEVYVSPVYELGESAYLRWLQVVCRSKINKGFFEDVHAALLEHGYESDAGDSKSIKSALVRFQRNNNLAAGSYDEITFKALDSDLAYEYFYKLWPANW